MKQTLKQGVPTPTAKLAINKSRLKVYGKKSEVPTYYLTKGQEFQIELFNPTTNNILAKISLNSKPIAQGGLVLRPGERVFLDRYIDVPRKFKFDTYEVANTNEVKAAIKDNGDFKVEFYSEYIPPAPTYFDISSYYNTTIYGTNNLNAPTTPSGPNVRTFGGTLNNVATGVGVTNQYNLTGSMGLGDGELTMTNTCVNYLDNSATGMATLDFFDMSSDRTPVLTTTPITDTKVKDKPRKRRLVKKKIGKTVETGRVEMGSTSNQEMTTVNMDWITIPFHTVEYKMLPLSQKVNTVEDTQVKRYCSNCGVKQKSNFKFCPSCGTRA